MTYGNEIRISPKQTVAVCQASEPPQWLMLDWRPQKTFRVYVIDCTNLQISLDETPMSARWPVERQWSLLSPKGEVTTVTNDGLIDFRACALLGSAGLGKSFEMASIASAAQEQHRPVVFRRLVELGLSQERLESQLNRIAERATEDSLILLDALDEVMVPLRTQGNRTSW